MGRTVDSQVVALKECAEVLPGFSVPGRIEHNPKGTHQLVLTKRLTNGVPYKYDAEHELRIVPGRETDRYEVRAGDVLFMSRGSRNLAWPIAVVPLPTIAPVSFYIIRPIDGVDAAYVAWYLNQAPAQAAIDQIRTGAGTPIVQRKAFRCLEIILPPVEVQREVAELAALLARERELYATLAAAVERTHTAIGKDLIQSLRARAPVRDRSNDG